MEQRNNLVLQGTETFSRGQLDNVALDGGAYHRMGKQTVSIAQHPSMALRYRYLDQSQRSE